MRYGGARCVVVLGPVFVIFNIGFFAFYVRQTVKQLSWPGGTVLLPPCRGAIFCVINKALPVADFYADVYDVTNRFGGPICQKHKKHMPVGICFLLFLYYSLFSHLFVLIGNPIWQGIRAVSTPQKILWHGHFPARGSAQGGPLPLQWQFHGLWCISSRFFPAKEGLSAVQSSMYRQGVLVRYRESFWLAAKRSTSTATTFAPGTR